MEQEPVENVEKKAICVTKVQDWQESDSEEELNDHIGPDDDTETDENDNEDEQLTPPQLRNLNFASDLDEDLSEQDEAKGEEGQDTCSFFDDSSDGTLDAHSESEDNWHGLPTNNGGGDADSNWNSDPSRQVIKVFVTPKRREHDPEAYNKWLKAKNEEIRRNREKEMAQKRELDKQRKLEEDKRREISKSKIQQWMDRKKKYGTNKDQTSTVNDPPKSGSSEYVTYDANANYQNWLKKVKKRDEEKAERELRSKKMDKEIRKERTKLSQDVYQKWLRTAKNKPKPVPLNQGPNTLRGTVSKLFINPKPWQSN